MQVYSIPLNASAFRFDCCHADSAAVAGGAAALIRAIVEGDGDGCDSGDAVAQLAEAGNLFP
jgi:hypothetical protein